MSAAAGIHWYAKLDKSEVNLALLQGHHITLQWEGGKSCLCTFLNTDGRQPKGPQPEKGHEEPVLLTMLNSLCISEQLFKPLSAQIRFVSYKRKRLLDIYFFKDNSFKQWL